jgi:hypothetical protein
MSDQPLSTTLSSALTRALQAGRGQFNARVAEACRSQPGFDTAAVETLLCGPLDQLAIQAAAVDAERANSLLLAAFDVGLTLILRGKAELPLVRALWANALPTCLPLALRQPRDTLGNLFNAALYLQSVAGARIPQWAQEMANLGGHCADLATLRGVGQILAWRAGVAHFRSGALQVAHSLPPELALAALAAAPGQDIATVLDQLAGGPWFDPARPAERGLRVVHEVGGFSGFGGPFAQPPEVRALADGFVLRCADRHWYLCADVFGAVLHAGSAEEFAAGSADAGALIFSGGEIRLGDARCALDLPAEGLQLVCGPNTAAACSPHSHFIRLLALA